ncbi:hypothetical protein BLNAU_23511 [Blattamonas nauphoetae]|uniref:Uncharacterized protein n=1 Tax=Blattamonas nauphoetae TaxID=2049346 RepID=A0ABQ9WQ28_9EUKA|nr:hypothetical protein BLNAU_24380 [Blattamonas nauphoetae]KAK2941582.1 hypothetical protein BLNAU_23511 [Blattamonas nauphoetae]
MPCPWYNPNDDSSTPLGNSIFNIYRATLTDPDLKVFHEKLMAMPFFFINYASYLDDNDPNWDVYLMCKKTNKCGDCSKPARVDFQILGYATVLSVSANSRLCTVPPSGSCHLSYRYGRVLNQKNAELAKDFRVDA